MTPWNDNKTPHKIDIEVPNGTSGVWSVSTYTVTEEDERWEMVRAAASSSSRGRYVSAGTYKALKRNGHVIMSNTPDEIRDHRYFFSRAKGKVLINGLGLGMALKAILNKVDDKGAPAVELVHVVEKAEDVLKLVRPTYESDKRVSFIHADALEYKSTLRYDVVWHDIFDDICADNLPIMHKLHRKYGGKAEWQGSWCRERCEYLLKQQRAHSRFW
jgi:hypothetical protein